MNYYSAAFTYLYEWVYYDRHYMKVLAFTDRPEPEAAAACKQLIGVATHYNVMRGFKVEEDGIARLLPVWEALKDMRKPDTRERAIDLVGQLVIDLRTTYNQKLDIRSLQDSMDAVPKSRCHLRLVDKQLDV